VEWVVNIDVGAWSWDKHLLMFGVSLPRTGLERSERNLELLLFEKFIFKVVNGQLVEVESGSRHVLLLFRNETGVADGC